jgi:hypothetical protein
MLVESLHEMVPRIQSKHWQAGVPCPSSNNYVLNKLQLENNQCFLQVSEHTQSMTNPKLTHLKEGMVEAFLKKMRLQIQKHNTQYILTRAIIGSVFAEWQTGQVVVQVLKGGDGLPSISPPFFSKQLRREINCGKFFQFLVDKIPSTILEQLQINSCILFNQNAINKIAFRGLDIWDMTKPTNQNTHMYC